MIRTSPNWFVPVIIGIINDSAGKVTLRSDEFGLNGIKTRGASVRQLVPKQH